MGPQGEEIVEATSLAARLGSAIVDIEVLCGREPAGLYCSPDVNRRMLV